MVPQHVAPRVDPVPNYTFCHRIRDTIKKPDQNKMAFRPPALSDEELAEYTSGFLDRIAWTAPGRNADGEVLDERS